MRLKDSLLGKIPEEKIKFVPSSFEMLGIDKKVVIVEIPKELEREKSLIGEAILQTNKNVACVLRKISARKGKLRKRKLELIAGKNDSEVLHKEYGYYLKIDPQKVYFSPRESTERQKIAEQVKSKENVLVMFSGICAYAIAVGKRQPNVEKIYAVEINKDAIKFAEENVRINKLSHKVVNVLQDVKIFTKKFPNKFDRIIMPLPLGAKNFLDSAVNCLKKKGIIHYYAISEEKNIFKDTEKELEILKKLSKSYKIIHKRIVLPYAPRKFKVAFDIEVRK